MNQPTTFPHSFFQKTSLLFFLILQCSIASFAQKALIKGTFENVKNESFRIVLATQYYSQEEKNSIYNVKLDQNGNFYQEIKLSNPQIIHLQYYDKNSKTRLLHHLFLTPGDNLNINIDTSLNPKNIKVSGKHKENNQFLDISKYIDLQKFKGDTLPDKVYNELERITHNNKLQLENYITKYKPTKEFIKSWQINLEYLAPQEYYTFEHNNKFSIRDSYARNIDKWKNYRNKLFSKIKISNDEALISESYQHLVRDILLRTKEELWKESSGENKEQFYKEWYNSSIVEGNKLFIDDPENILTEKIIQKYYTGKSAESAYAILFKGSIEQENNKNLPQIFENFKKQFPNSKYIAQFEPKINKIIENNNKTLTEKMAFIEKGEELKTFEEVINQFKGKTVLIDMWGTWCSPCKKEITQHSQALHEYFKNKELQFLYIANYDIHNPENWKKMIAYHSIEGNHILANDALTNDIMTKTKGKGYPTYIILKKDGSYELSKAGYPMNRETLIKQLDDAIN
ncbi:TlpA family protein disulfide reductase [Flavobacterium daejeonense]|uniref:TlpA family protein disulfide reductase n=1 Tax=Flavobacterium daejeonense TaxID=350893 RepID=UPI00068C35F2|nr:TlpA disulfide reductase family protein [Flavobacterium daejeonense]